MNDVSVDLAGTTIIAPHEVFTRIFLFHSPTRQSEIESLSSKYFERIGAIAGNFELDDTTKQHQRGVASDEYMRSLFEYWQRHSFWHEGEYDLVVQCISDSKPSTIEIKVQFSISEEEARLLQVNWLHVYNMNAGDEPSLFQNITTKLRNIQISNL